MIIQDGEMCLVQFEREQMVLINDGKVGNDWYQGQVTFRYMADNKNIRVLVPMKNIIKIVTLDKDPELFL